MKEKATNNKLLGPFHIYPYTKFETSKQILLKLSRLKVNLCGVVTLLNPKYPQVFSEKQKGQPDYVQDKPRPSAKRSTLYMCKGDIFMYHTH